MWVWSTNKKNPIQTINIEARELEEDESGYRVIFDENLIPGKHYFISVVSISNGRSSRVHTVRTKLSKFTLKIICFSFQIYCFFY